VRSKDYGSGARVNIENITGNLFGANGALQIDDLAGHGRNSQVNLNGVTIIKPGNSFTIDGVNYNLYQTTDEAVNIDIKRDIQHAFDVIKGFVDQYNDLLGHTRLPLLCHLQLGTWFGLAS
jgi:flagellar hook-associated protein 2